MCKHNSFRKARLTLLALAAAGAFPSAQAQTQTLPAVTVTAPRGGSLTVPTAAEAAQEINQTPGAVEVVPASSWQDTPAATLKDMLDFTPGVFAQPKWGGDSRLSIRGSGLARYYHLRGIELLQDGVPMNNADGSADFQMIDPSAYQFVEVYKGANALRFGAATLGGAINFVSPTGHDSDRFQARVDTGSFGWRRTQASTGFVSGKVDGFITGSWQRESGFREHSRNHAVRVNGNLGLRLANNAETRFYLFSGSARNQLPGSVTRNAALHDPRRAAAINVLNDWQRNDDVTRISNRTTFISGNTTYEAGGWFSRMRLDHPIYQYLDNGYNDYGLYARAQNETPIAGHDNRATLGLRWSAGTVNARNYVNSGGQKNGLLSHVNNRADNITVYGENAYHVVPDVSLIAGFQYLSAERKQTDLFNGVGPANRSGSRTYNLFNPKLGVLWQAGPTWQVYGNVSRSGEPPTFGDMQFSTQNDLARLNAQRGTTIEVGTRGSSKDWKWDVAAYRARLKNEIECVSSQFNICQVAQNLDHTIHQGIEAGLQWTALRGLFVDQARSSDSLNLKVAYTYSNFYFQNDPIWGNNQLPGMPRHYLRGELVYKHPSGFYGGPTVEWVPQAYYADNANTLKTAPYALLGLRAGYNQGPYSLFIEGRNLTNRTYIASASITDRANTSSPLFEPGAGRAVYVGLQIRY
jgi:iron complex outermembrane receptor protein